MTFLLGICGKRNRRVTNNDRFTFSIFLSTLVLSVLCLCIRGEIENPKNRSSELDVLLASRHLAFATFLKYDAFSWLRESTSRNYNTTATSNNKEVNHLDAGVLKKFLAALNGDGKVERTIFEKYAGNDDAVNKCINYVDANFNNDLDKVVQNNFTKLSSDSGEIEALCDVISQTRCLSMDKLLSLIDKDVTRRKTKEFPSVVAQLCPLLLFQSHDPKCQQVIAPPTNKNHDQPISGAGQLSELEEENTSLEKQATAQLKPRVKPSSTAVWGFGFLFVTVVSCCSLVGVALLPLLSKDIYQAVLVLFEGLAVGSLASSALFHLIPQAFGLLGQDTEHKYLWKALIMFGGIYVFFLSERGMKIIIQKREKKKFRKKNPDIASLRLSPSDLSGNGQIDNLKAVVTNGGALISNNHILDDHSPNHQLVHPNDLDTTACLSAVPIPHHSHSHSHSAAFHHAAAATDGADGGAIKQSIATVAWMIIFGDGLHNFIDGLSMGAAFSESILSGISISVAVICEEFPHELGDFAVLLSAGMTIKQALMYNFLSALTCYLGLIFGVLLGDMAEGGPYIFAFAGGMFLYISLVDMVAELSEALEAASLKGTKEMLKIFALQNIGILVGVAVLFLMARYSENINFQSIGEIGKSFSSEGMAGIFGKHSSGDTLIGTFGDA